MNIKNRLNKQYKKQIILKSAKLSLKKIFTSLAFYAILCMPILSTQLAKADENINKNKANTSVEYNIESNHLDQDSYDSPSNASTKAEEPSKDISVMISKDITQAVESNKNSQQPNEQKIFEQTSSKKEYNSKKVLETVDKTVKEIKAKILDTVKASWFNIHNIIKITEYFENLKDSTIFLWNHAQAKFIIAYALLVSVVLFAFSFTVGALSLRLFMSKHIKNIHLQQIYKWIINTITFSTGIIVTNINPVFSKITTTMFIGIASYAFIRNILLYLSNAEVFSIHKKIRYSLLHFLQWIIYSSSFIYSTYLWIGLVKLTDTDYYNMMQLQGLTIAAITIFGILIKKSTINKIIFNTLQKQRKAADSAGNRLMFIVYSITMLWHWIAIFLTLLIVSAWIIPGDWLDVALYLFITMLIIPFAIISWRYLRAMSLKYIRSYSNPKRHLLFEIYKKLFNTAKLLTVLLYVFIVGYIWQFNAFKFTRDIITPPLFDKIIIGFTLLTISKISIAAIDYQILINRNKSGNIDNKQKAQQLIKILKVLARIAIYLIAFVLAIMFFGYDPMPFISGFGFLSFAISIGAQSVIKDLFAGFFLILDRTMDIGDKVIIHNQSGVVEELSLYAMKIRLENGYLLTAQYGDIRQLTNQSRAYAYAIIEISVSHNTNPDTVFEILEQIYKDIKTSHSLGKKIIAPIEIRGIDKVDGNEMKISALIMTKPRNDFPVKRLFYKKMKEAFDKQGIQFADTRVVAVQESK